MSDPEVPQFPPLEPVPGGEEGATSAPPPPPAESYDTVHGERLWGMLAYLLTFLGSATFLGAIIPPIVLYAVKREQSRFIAFHALQSLLLTLGYLVLVIAMLFILPRGFEPLLAVLWIGQLIYSVLAAVKAYDGEWFRIPFIGDLAAAQVGAPR